MRCYPIFLAALILALSGPQARASDPPCRELHAGGSAQWAPIIWRADQTSRPIGILPDVIELIANELDLKVVFDPQVPWKRLLVKMDQGQMDVAMGAYFTEERNLRFRYTSPVLRDEVAIFTRRDNMFEFTRLEDLIGRTGIRPHGGSYGEEFDRFAERHLKFKRMPTLRTEQLLQALINKRADYLVLGRFDGLRTLRQSGMDRELIDLPTAVRSNPVHYMFSKTAPCAGQFAAFNEALDRLLATGKLNLIIQRHLHKPAE